MPVGVAADIVQHLQIRDGFHGPPVQIPDGSVIVQAVLLAQVAHVHALGLHHEGALHGVAVLVDHLHGDGFCQQIGDVQQLRHGVHGGVAAVHPGAVVDPGDLIVVDDGSAQTVQLRGHDPGRDRSGFPQDLLRAQGPLRGGIEPGHELRHGLFVASVAGLHQPLIEGRQLGAAVRLLRQAQDQGPLGAVHGGHKAPDKGLARLAAVLAVGLLLQGPVQAVPVIRFFRGGEEAGDLPALAVQEGQGLALVLIGAHGLPQHRSPGIHRQRADRLQQLRQALGLLGVIALQGSVVARRQGGDLLHQSFALLVPLAPVDPLGCLADLPMQLHEPLPALLGHRGNPAKAVRGMQTGDLPLRVSHRVQICLIAGVLTHQLFQLLLQPLNAFLWHIPFLRFLLS